MLTPKFVKAHYISSAGAFEGERWFFKLMYEFWGFCVNGSDNLRVPGGFPVTGVYGMPWMGPGDSPYTGSSDLSLITSGSDGFTEVGMPFFNTVNHVFSSSYVNLYLVTWKSGSTSTDDSIYQITQWLNSSSVRVNVLQGGTPYSGSMHPAFTTRSNINYRIVDFTRIVGLALSENTSSLTFQFNGADAVNPGQRHSQARVKHFKAAPGSPYVSSFAGGVTIQISPSGTWHGPEYSSGSYSSGSTVYATGNQPFAFLQPSTIVFTGSYTNLTGGVANSTAGATLVGNMTGTMTLPGYQNYIHSGTFLSGGLAVVTGVAGFSGTLGGVEGHYFLTGTFLPSDVAAALSFSGTYHFSASGIFTPTGTLLPPGFHSESINEYIQGSGNSSYMWNAGVASPAYVTLIGATDFLITHYKYGASAGAAGFHIEIPQRLYPQAVDPNPIACMAYGFSGVSTTNSGYTYSAGMAMHNPPDNTLMNYRGFVRRFFGNSDQVTPTSFANGRYNGAFYNTYQNKFLFGDVVLGNVQTSGQYQMARARLRRVRVLPPIIPQFERVGNSGEWLHIQNGVMWPWDNSLLPYNLFLGGS